MSIKNDQQFKQQLSELSIAQQRMLAAQFIDSVAALNTDPVIGRAVEIIRSGTYSQSELEDIAGHVQSLAVKTYTACGANADWLAQAAHFVASAARTCLQEMLCVDKNQDKKNLAWKCAMQTRMARNCEMIESDADEIANEAQQQYAMVDAVLD